MIGFSKYAARVGAGGASLEVDIGSGRDRILHSRVTPSHILYIDLELNLDVKIVIIVD